MLGGCKIVKENLEEVVKTLNELLQEAYAKDEIAFALKCKTEELETAKAEIERLKKGWKADILLTQNTKAEAYKECVEKVKYKLKDIAKIDWQDNYYYLVGTAFFDNLLKELVGEDNG